MSVYLDNLRLDYSSESALREVILVVIVIVNVLGIFMVLSAVSDLRDCRANDFERWSTKKFLK